MYAFLQVTLTQQAGTEVYQFSEQTFLVTPNRGRGVGTGAYTGEWERIHGKYSSHIRDRALMRMTVNKLKCAHCLPVDLRSR